MDFSYSVTKDGRAYVLPPQGRGFVLVARRRRRRRVDLGWTYEEPLHEAAAITGLVALWDELVDVYLDGERRERPTGLFADALRDEFGVPSAGV